MRLAKLLAKHPFCQCLHFLVVIAEVSETSALTKRCLSIWQGFYFSVFIDKVSETSSFTKCCLKVFCSELPLICSQASLVNHIFMSRVLNANLTRVLVQFVCHKFVSCQFPREIMPSDGFSFSIACWGYGLYYDLLQR